jgi:hypothetical protein
LREIPVQKGGKYGLKKARGIISLSFPVSGSRLLVPVMQFPFAHAHAITSGTTTQRYHK